MKDVFSIAGKVALVTGGSSGIGAMIARAFVEAGARVYITSRKKENCDAVAAQLTGPGTCVSLPADLSRLEEIERVAVELAQREEKLDILVNNAGVTWGSPLDSFPETGWDKVMTLNAKSVFFLSQKLLPLLEKAGEPLNPARIVNIGSVEGIHVSPIFEVYSYSASKAAVHHLTRLLAKQLAPRNINVVAIAPGPFKSEMMKRALDSVGEQVLETVPQKRFGTIEDIGGTAIYLCSRAGAYVTGVVLPLDGGITGTL